MSASAAARPERTYFRNYSNLTPTQGESLTIQMVRKFFPAARKTEHDEVWMRDIDAKALLTQPVLQVELHEAAIREHAARRIRWFYLQIIACWGTRKKFEICDTKFQSDQAYPFNPVTPSFPKGAFVVRRQAAHSSILPSIRVREEEADYLCLSDLHRTFNSTVTLPTLVNHPIDTSLERASAAKAKPLTLKALGLLNLGADEKYPPERLIAHFVGFFRKEVDAFDASKSTSLAGPVALNLVKRYYIETCAKWEALLRREPDHLAQELCRVDYTLEEAGRATIHRHAEAAIRRQQEVRSELGEMLGAFCDRTFPDRADQPFFWDNMIDYSVRNAPSTVRTWLMQYASYPGDLRKRTTYVKVEQAPGRVSTPANKTTLTSAEDLIGSFVIQDDGSRQMMPMWNEGLQSRFLKTDFSVVWGDLTMSIEELWEEEKEHACRTYEILLKVFDQPKVEALWGAYLLGISEDDPRHTKIGALNPASQVWDDYEPGSDDGEPSGSSESCDEPSHSDGADSGASEGAATSQVCRVDPEIFRLHF